MPAEVASSHPSASDKPSTGSSNEYVRLHITPLDPELCKIIIPAAVQPFARNISYHTLETFPEKRYGFVELPQMDADKLKNKLNGATLKGIKVRIEKARPEERIEPTGEVEKVEKKRKKSKDDLEGSKKRKRDVDVMEGVTLKDRKVKRGWTESVDTKIKNKRSKDRDSKSKDRDSKSKDKDSKDKEKEKRKRIKSKYTDQEECLLKVKVPLNAVGNLPEADAPKRRKKKGKSREVTVHEFEKTTKFPSFLKATDTETSGNPATEFVDGKGWVDEEGNVVEEVKMKAKTAAPKRKEKAKPKAIVEEESDDSTSSSGTSSEEEDEEEEPDAEEAGKELRKVEDEDESSEEDEPSAPREHAASLSAIKADSSRPMSSSSSKSLKIKIPPPATPSAAKVHPLEALYKRQKPEPAATETPAEPEPFSFFGGGDDEEDEEGEDSDQPSAAVPLTPYTSQDSEYRRVRSAAPTPDTAHPSRMKNFWAPQDNEDEDEDEDDEMGDAADAAGEEEAPVEDQQGKSDFQSWFWENRRELNRSWMTRRKTAAKEKRHRENKARANKAI